MSLTAVKSMPYHKGITDVNLHRRVTILSLKNAVFCRNQTCHPTARSIPPATDAPCSPPL